MLSEEEKKKAAEDVKKQLEREKAARELRKFEKKDMEEKTVVGKQTADIKKRWEHNTGDRDKGN